MPRRKSLSRRQFTGAAIGLAAVGALKAPALLGANKASGEAAGGFKAFEHLGVLIDECTLPGETRADDVFPAHPNGIQVSRDRWMLLYATRGFRGGDDDRSIVFQLRRGAPDGPVITEGMLARSLNDWDPFNEGKRYVKQHGHPVGFGVPRGALVGGKPAPNANLFVIKWRVLGLTLDPKTGRIGHDSRLSGRTQGVEWVQLRLNRQEDDIQIVRPACSMRQKGYPSGEAYCSAAGAGRMNQTYTQAVPFNRECTEWANCNHFSRARVAALKYVYNPSLGVYEWARTGPFLFDRPVTEASLTRFADQWIVAARMPGKKGVAWLRTPDPFVKGPAPIYAQAPGTNVPRTAYTCADGVLRLFSGDVTSSPYGDNRNPLYFWDVDPDNGFAPSNRRVIFDAVKAGLGTGGRPMIGMCKLLSPHGRSQLVLHRVAPRVYNPELTEEDKAHCAVHYGRITYQEVGPPLWEFPSGK